MRGEEIDKRKREHKRWMGAWEILRWLLQQNALTLYCRIMILLSSTRRAAKWRGWAPCGGREKRVVGANSKFPGLGHNPAHLSVGLACNVTTSSPANSPSLAATCQPRDLGNQIYTSSLIRFRREVELLKIR
jgi:hypothetical protein